MHLQYPHNTHDLNLARTHTSRSLSHLRQTLARTHARTHAHTYARTHRTTLRRRGDAGVVCRASESHARAVNGHKKQRANRGERERTTANETRTHSHSDPRGICERTDFTCLAKSAAPDPTSGGPHNNNTTRSQTQQRDSNSSTCDATRHSNRQHRQQPFSHRAIKCAARGGFEDCRKRAHAREKRRQHERRQCERTGQRDARSGSVPHCTLATQPVRVCVRVCECAPAKGGGPIAWAVSLWPVSTTTVVWSFSYGYGIHTETRRARFPAGRFLLLLLLLRSGVRSERTPAQPVSTMRCAVAGAVVVACRNASNVQQFRCRCAWFWFYFAG